MQLMIHVHLNYNESDYIVETAASFTTRRLYIPKRARVNGQCASKSALSYELVTRAVFHCCGLTHGYEYNRLSWAAQIRVWLRRIRAIILID